MVRGKWNPVILAGAIAGIALLLKGGQGGTAVRITLEGAIKDANGRQTFAGAGAVHGDATFTYKVGTPGFIGPTLPYARAVLELSAQTPSDTTIFEVIATQGVTLLETRGETASVTMPRASWTFAGLPSGAYRVEVRCVLTIPTGTTVIRVVGIATEAFQVV